MRVRGDQSKDTVLTVAPYNLPIGQGFQDGTADTVTVDRPDAANVRLQYGVSVNLASALVPIASVSSLDLDGSTDSDTFKLIETANGLPSFAGSNPNGHNNATFFARTGLALASNPGISVSGGGGASNSLQIDDSVAGAVRNVIYTPDTTATANGSCRSKSSTAYLATQVSFSGLSPRLCWSQVGWVETC